MLLLDNKIKCIRSGRREKQCQHVGFCSGPIMLIHGKLSHRQCHHTVRGACRATEGCLAWLWLQRMPPGAPHVGPGSLPREISSLCLRRARLSHNFSHHRALLGRKRWDQPATTAALRAAKPPGATTPGHPSAPRAPEPSAEAPSPAAAP